MSRDERLKILVLGPSKVGKTVVADYLSGTRDTPTMEYKETNPLRILECSLDGLHLDGARRGRGTRADVELWDVAGNTRHQNCWPAIKNSANGIIFVINPEVDGQERELEFWHKFFAAEGVPAEHCIVFAHNSTPQNASPPPKPRMTGPLQPCSVVETSLEFKADEMKRAFEQLVERILIARREAQENAVMKNDVMAGAIAIGATQ